MRLIIVRHGETKENVARIVQGQTHGSLTSRGKMQAKKAGLRLKKERISAFYSSDLGRAIETLLEIARHHNFRKIRLSDKLRERNLGEFQGRPSHELHFAVEKSGGENGSFRPRGGGETHSDVKRRVMSIVKRIAKAHPKENVVIVTHGGAILNLFRGLFGIEEKVGNASVSIIEFDGKNFRPILINCTKHLGKKRAEDRTVRN